MRIYAYIKDTSTFLLFAALLSTPAPTAVIVGIASIALFAIVGLMVGPDYDGMNAPEVKK